MPQKNSHQISALKLTLSIGPIRLFGALLIYMKKYLLLYSFPLIGLFCAISNGLLPDISRINFIQVENLILNFKINI